MDLYSNHNTNKANKLSTNANEYPNNISLPILIYRLCNSKKIINANKAATNTTGSGTISFRRPHTIIISAKDKITETTPPTNGIIYKITIIANVASPNLKLPFEIPAMIAIRRHSIPKIPYSASTKS